MTLNIAIESKWKKNEKELYIEYGWQTQRKNRDWSWKAAAAAICYSPKPAGEKTGLEMMWDSAKSILINWILPKAI